ncbi:MAG: hypothetical protein AB1416_04400, partial [Actinomycetota bacterium]
SRDPGPAAAGGEAWSAVVRAAGPPPGDGDALQGAIRVTGTALTHPTPDEEATLVALAEILGLAVAAGTGAPPVQAPAEGGYAPSGS